ncbi:MAG: hypothetical protein R3C61_28835 [Bacteroidia bacterium]
MNAENRINWLGLFVLFFLAGCGGGWELAHFTVREKDGLARHKEYVEAYFTLADPDNPPVGVCMISGTEKGHTSVQFRQTADNPAVVQVVFPVAISANGIRHVSLVACSDTVHAGYGTLETKTEDSVFSVSNSYFLADLGSKTDIPGRNYPVGHLTALILKEFDNQRIQRSGMKIHWSPNFAKENTPYTTMAHMEPEKMDVFNGKYMTRIEKSGTAPGYGEIGLAGEYVFYDSLPYFLFSSEMTFRQSVVLNLLRNDEMTMDSLFTHLSFRREGGEVETMPLYHDSTFAYLENHHIEENAPWLFFFHESAGYAFGVIRVDEDYTNTRGDLSPLYEAHTKITQSASNGRYWNRRLIHDHPLEVPEGSRYYEKNAYVVFQYIPEESAAYMDSLGEILMHPLHAEIN